MLNNWFVDGKYCLYCHKKLVVEMSWASLFKKESGKKLCDECHSQLVEIRGKTCIICSRPLEQLDAQFVQGDMCHDCYRWEQDERFKNTLDRNISLYLYNDFMKELISCFKYRGDYILAQIFSDQLQKQLQKRVGPEFSSTLQKRVGPEFSSTLQKRVGPEFSSTLQKRVDPEFSSILQKRVGPEFSPILQKRVGLTFSSSMQNKDRSTVSSPMQSEVRPTISSPMQQEGRPAFSQDRSTVSSPMQQQDRPAFSRSFFSRPTAFSPAPLIVPIPLSEEREWERGFNQAEALIVESGFSPTHLLKRIHSEKQSKKSRIERIQLPQVFRLAYETDLTGEMIILVDDIYTTGSTLRHAAKILKDAGAKTVISITVAR